MIYIDADHALSQLHSALDRRFGVSKPVAFPVGLPPITVQELETLISQCDPRSFLGRALDTAVEAFVERRRDDVLQAFRDVARVARQWRSVPKAAAPARLWDAAALACWRLYRESAP